VGQLTQGLAVNRDLDKVSGDPNTDADIQGIRSKATKAN